MLLNCGVGEDSWESLQLQRSNQSILNEISPKYSLEGRCWGWNSNTLATWCKELTHWKRPWCLERLKSGGARGWQQMRCLDGITDSFTDSADMSLSKLQKFVKDKKAWHPEVHGVTKNWTWLSDWTELTLCGRENNGQERLGRRLHCSLESGEGFKEEVCLGAQWDLAERTFQVGEHCISGWGWGHVRGWN